MDNKYMLVGGYKTCEQDSPKCPHCGRLDFRCYTTIVEKDLTKRVVTWQREFDCSYCCCNWVQYGTTNITNID